MFLRSAGNPHPPIVRQPVNSVAFALRRSAKSCSGEGFNYLKLPSTPGDKWEHDFLLLSDVFSTAYHATELSEVRAGKRLRFLLRVRSDFFLFTTPG
jgi:hypothetical protein